MILTKITKKSFHFNVCVLSCVQLFVLDVNYYYYIITCNILFGINYYIFKNSVPYLIHCGLSKQYKDTMKNGTKEISTFEYEYIQIN